MTTALRPGAARLAALEDKPRNGSPIRDIQDKLDQALQGAHDPDDGVLSLPGVITEQSLSLPVGLTIEQWQAVGFTLRRINAAWRWWVGDWLHYGEQSFGEMASQAMNDLGVDYQQLADCAWVAGRIPVSRRRENVSWSMHREVAPLDPGKADDLLDQAEQGHWTRAHLREVVKGAKPVPEPNALAVPAAPLLRFCPPDMTAAQIVTGILRVAFPDAQTVLDTTYGHGAFWDGSAHVQVTGVDRNPSRAPDGTADFRDLPHDDEAYDVVTFDPPHLADGGADSIMAQRYGTYSDDNLEPAVRAGVQEAWRVARLGIIVKVTDAVHGQQYVAMSDWVRDTVGVPLYDVVYETRGHSMIDPKWGTQLSAYNNGATYLVFRKDAVRHVLRVGA